ncbi:hypothetical protein [Prosthecobacter sp.]|uniref:hypothetical protein n=1 Tax=Prosthecobacter sp. TaxID=1965333 RepID=UPI002ABA2022|nr:hypothetical protein [Prosthecobacter sp.]MDZ4403780.1 hypothetical protein [Prosthecobacter sp.]
MIQKSKNALKACRGDTMDQLPEFNRYKQEHSLDRRIHANAKDDSWEQAQRRAFVGNLVHRVIDLGASEILRYRKQLEESFQDQGGRTPVMDGNRLETASFPDAVQPPDFLSATSAQEELEDDTQGPSQGRVEMYFSKRPIPLGQQVLLEAKDYADYYEIKIEIAYNLWVDAGEPDAIEACAAEITHLIRNLADHPHFSEKHKVSLLEAWGAKDERIKEAAKKALLHLYKLKGRVVTPATVEWTDGDQVICRFEHPQRERYGWVEREFRRDELPEGSEEGAGFDLEIDLDADGRPVEYRPLKNGPKRPAEPDALEAAAASLPSNLTDQQGVAGFEQKEWSRLEEQKQAAEPYRAAAR